MGATDDQDEPELHLAAGSYTQDLLRQVAWASWLVRASGGIMTRNQHAAQTDRVRQSLLAMPIRPENSRPEYDLRRAAILRVTDHIGRGTYQGN